MDSLAKQDRNLLEIGCRLNYKSSCKKVAICVRPYFITNCLFSLNEFFSYGINFSMLLDWLTYWLPLIIHKMNICLYLCLIWIIGVRFKALNKQLEFIVRSSNPNSLLLLGSKEYIRIIRTVGNVHAQLCKIGQSLNHIFIITLLTSTVEAFVLITVLLYSLIMEIQGNQNYTQLLNDSFLLIMCGVPIITIVTMCNWTKKQASATEKLIHKINVWEKNNVLSELIQIFSMQMLHQKLSFSVGGFFTLDPALLQAITAAITTNLIILIQFGQMENILLHKN